MSKVTMPDPLAWMLDEANQIGSLSTRLCWARHSVPPSYGQNHKGLVTVEMAEEYAAARVREALEEAADIANEWAMKYVEVDTAHVKVGFYILDEMKPTN